MASSLRTSDISPARIPDLSLFFPPTQKHGLTAPGWQTRQHMGSYFSSVSTENYKRQISQALLSPSPTLQGAPRPSLETLPLWDPWAKRPSCLSDAPKCSRVRGCPQTSPQSQRGRIWATGNRPSAPQLQEILSHAGLPSSPTPALPAGLPPSLPAAVPSSPSLCSPESESILWAAARASTTARLRGAPGSGGRGTHGMGCKESEARAVQSGQCVARH